MRRSGSCRSCSLKLKGDTATVSIIELPRFARASIDEAMLEDSVTKSARMAVRATIRGRRSMRFGSWPWSCRPRCLRSSRSGTIPGMTTCRSTPPPRCSNRGRTLTTSGHSCGPRAVPQGRGAGTLRADRRYPLLLSALAGAGVRAAHGAELPGRQGSVGVSRLSELGPCGPRAARASGAAVAADDRPGASGRAGVHRCPPRADVGPGAPAPGRGLAFDRAGIGWLGRGSARLPDLQATDDRRGDPGRADLVGPPGSMERRSGLRGHAG